MGISRATQAKVLFLNSQGVFFVHLFTVLANSRDTLNFKIEHFNFQLCSWQEDDMARTEVEILVDSCLV